MTGGAGAEARARQRAVGRRRDELVDEADVDGGGAWRPWPAARVRPTATTLPLAMAAISSVVPSASVGALSACSAVVLLPRHVVDAADQAPAATSAARACRRRRTAARRAAATTGA